MQRRNLLDCQHLQASVACRLQLIVQANITQSTYSQDHTRGDGAGGGGGGGVQGEPLVFTPRAPGASIRGRREGRGREGGRERQAACPADVMCLLWSIKLT